MGRAALAVALSLCLGLPGPGAAAPSRRGAAAAKTSPSKKGRAPTLAQAQAAMKSLMRDRVKRRYRHHWERAIRGLLAAARGRDAAEGNLEAARARYALYRWSANEADRDEALRLAGVAAKLGSRDASGLAKAIRREAGEDERPARPSRRGAPARGDPADEEPPPDPELERALADLSAAEAAPELPLGAAGGRGRARVSEVRTWSGGGYTRVAVHLSHWVGWQKLELPAEPGRPRRFALDFRPAALSGAALARPVAGAQVDRVRAAQNDPETVRVVLDLPGGDDVQVFALQDPPRLVIDVGAHDVGPQDTGPPPVAAAPPQAPPAEAAPAPEPPRAAPPALAGAIPEQGAEAPRGPVRRIVVDAGHGGHDPGAIGPRRIREKDVTLQISRRLAKRLRAEGFEVVLTRADDRYLALEERTALANAANADLFVSIHANAHPRRNRNGVETYFLNVTDDRYASRLAARENGVDVEASAELLRILSDLDANASAGASRKLAGLVQREVTRGVRASVGDVRDLGVKSALFYVLLGARMPAVLVEAGFISNRDEERRLSSARYQEEVAAGIARAVSAFARPGREVAAAR